MSKPDSNERGDRRTWPFFVGLTLGVLVSVPVVIVGLEYLADQVTGLVVALTVLLLVSAGIFGVLFLLKERLFTFFLRGASGSLERFVEKSCSTIDDMVVCNWPAASESGKSAILEFTSMYIWARVRLRMITWLFGLVIAIGAYVQGMLLFRQNELFTEQNGIQVAQSELAARQTVVQLRQQENEVLALRASLADRSNSLLSTIHADVAELRDNSIAQLSRFTEEEKDSLQRISLSWEVPPKWSEILDGHELTNEAFWQNCREPNESEGLAIIKLSRLWKALRDQPYLGSENDLDRSVWDTLRNATGVDSFNAIQTFLRRPIPAAYHLSIHRYAEIATAFEVLGDAAGNNQGVFQEAKADLLLSLLRTQVSFPFSRGGVDLRHAHFANREIRQLDFSRLDLEACKFESVELRNVKFHECDLRGVNFHNCTFLNCTFDGSILPKPSCWKDVTIDSHATFDGAYVATSEWLPEVLGDDSSSSRIANQADDTQLIEINERSASGFAASFGFGRDALRGEHLWVHPPHQGYKFQLQSLLDRPVQTEVAGLPFAVFAKATDGHLKLTDSELALEAIHYRDREPPLLDFSSPTGITIDLEYSASDLGAFLSRIAGECETLTVTGVLPSAVFSVEDYARFKERMPECKVEFRVPDGTVIRHRRDSVDSKERDK